MVYKFKTGSRLKADAQKAGEQCAALEAQGRLTAAELVEENRPKEAPLHGAFEWRDKVAGQLWREHQARHIINSLEVVMEEGGADPVRAYFNIAVRDPNYYHVQTVLREQSMTDAMLLTALRELKALEKKYAQLEALADVWAALRNVKEEIA